MYGEADPALTYQVTTGILVEGDGFGGELTRDAGETVGTYAIHQGTVALSSNYSLTFVGANLTVTRATLTITADDWTKTYGQTTTFAGTEFTTNGLLNADTVTSVTLTSTGAAATATVANSPYSITPSAAVGTGLDNYTITYIDGALTVNTATLTITVADASRIYHQPNPAFTGTIDGLQNNDAISAVYTTAATFESPVGSYDIGATIVDPSRRIGNYSVVIDKGALTIEKAQPILTFTTPVNTAPFTGSTSLAPVSVSLVEQIGGRAVAGKVVSVSAAGTTAQATTNDSGMATAQLPLAIGEYVVNGEFARDENYLPATTSTPQGLYVYQPTQFVIWGGNAPSLETAVRVGDRYLFWGAQWAKQVAAGSDGANESFKGYADRVSGTQWSATGGASSAPPAAISTYVGVIVTTQTARNRSDTVGNIAEIVVLKVDDVHGYAPNPGHSATGVMVARTR
ncbi:MAG: MBG-2 domain-containing protein [Acidobacteria bacterium]|nr:MBG-2 domain-containing protein [Acidobacteriota bacterium]